MSGPKIFKIPELTRNFQKKVKENYSHLLNIQKSDLFLHLKAINLLLSSKNGIGVHQKISKDLINEDCFIIENNEFIMEEFNN